jgi:hypothetical protein
MALQHHPSDMMYRRVTDAFNCLYTPAAVGRDRPDGGQTPRGEVPECEAADVYRLGQPRSF